MKNLKIYDPDPERNFTKAKLARRPRNEQQRENGETASDAANHSGTFPPLIEHLVMLFTVLPTIVPTDTLEHLKGSECSHFCSRPPSVCESKFRG